jgi:hypothetical protein
MKAFPEPPSVPCLAMACLLEGFTRQLTVCKCTLRAAFANVTLFPDALKIEILRWHPYRFAVCSEEVRTEMTAKAEEVFVVVNGLY